MSRRDMLEAGVLFIALASVVLGGCATESPASQKTETDDEGFFEEIFNDEPELVTVPQGTVLPVVFRDTLSSAESAVGQPFEVELTQDVAAGGKVAIPAGSRIHGSVTEAHGPKKIGGRSRLSLDFHTLELANGDTVPVRAAFAQAGRSETPKDAAIIGGSTLGGAILGEAVDEGEGTVVGGVVGAIGGVVGAIKTKGKPVTVPAGTRMNLVLDAAVEIEV